MQQDGFKSLARHLARTDGIGGGRGEGRVPGDLRRGFVFLAVVEYDRDQALGF